MKIRAAKTGINKWQTKNQTQTQTQTQDKATPTTSKRTLEPSESDPPKLFILPKNVSVGARIVTLPHPVTTKANRYFVDPESGFYEFTRVSAPKKACRSVLLTSDTQEASGPVANEEGYILQTPDLFIATPIDPLFLLLLVLWPAGAANCEEAWSTSYDRLFQSDNNLYRQLGSIFKSEGGRGLEARMEDRMRAVCDKIEMGDETSYKLNAMKLASVVYEKARNMVNTGLPASMEEHFVKRPLEAPELSVKREDSNVSIVDANPAAAKEEPAHPPPNPTNLHHLLRLRTSLTYLTTAYIPPTLTIHLHPLLNILIDFTPLTTRLTHLAKLRAEAQALRSISDNISRKRGVLDDDEALEKAEAKKRKKEEDEARKRNVSLGVKRLGKVDTKGMKKMSSFFTANAPAKKG